MKEASGQHVADGTREKKMLFIVCPLPSIKKGRSLLTDCCLLSAEKGVTLVELMVVVSIIAILVVALGFQYSGWQGKYKVESQVKQMYSDLLSARVRAMQTGANVFVNFPPGTSTNTYYQVLDDTNGNNSLDAGTDQVVPAINPNPKPTNYTLKTYSVDDSASPPTAAKAINTVVISFDRRGIISCPVLFTAASQPEGVISFTSGDNLNPDYDCIVINGTMINTGKKVCSTTTSTMCYKDADCPSGETCSLCQIK